MNKQAILHNHDTKYCFATSNNSVCLRLRVARDEDIKQINVVYNNKYDFPKQRNKVAMYKGFSDSLYDYYIAYINLKDVRFAYIFELIVAAQTYYFSEDGLTDGYNFDLGYYNFFQLSYINAVDVFETVDWMKNVVFYQIFVDRFNRGNRDKDDSYINIRWGDLPTSKSFAGGDLQGIRSKIGYLKDLGIGALYLTPIFQSTSNHKYDISDYYQIDKQFGNTQDLQQLVDECHANGIKVVLDAVFNHCSSDSKEFCDCKKIGRKSKYFDWFIIDGDYPDMEKVNYQCFASCSYMPKWNTSNIEVQKFLIDIATYWIKQYDIDGWRLDVSDEASHDFWRQFRKAVKSAKRDAVIIGENWHDAESYLRGDQQDSIMNYSFTKACLDYFAFGIFDEQDLANKLNEILMRNVDQANQMMLNLLDSHDTERFLNRLDGDKDKLLSALALEMVFVGTPCIYYGTEIGLLGGYDPDCRRTFDWKNFNNDRVILPMLTKLIKLRNESKVIANGDIKITSKNGKLIVERQYKGSKLTLTVGDKGKTFELEIDGEKLI